MSNIYLSIILCSHNQVQYLERCVMSIINQALPFDYEIILSDDASTDGTWELANKLAKRYPQIKPTQCNTHDYPCYTNSQRSGWNRQNAYKLLTGKYVVFIDADDYYKEGTRILQKQWEMLEAHPECEAAMANNIVINEGADWNTACYQNEEQVYEVGHIITAKEYMDEKGFRSVTAFMFRHKEQYDLPMSHLRGFCADTSLAAYYLQFGDIICLDNKDSGYVYVQYPKSASHNSTWQEQDWLLWGSRCLYIPALVPYWQQPYLHSRKYRGSMLAIVKRIRRNKRFNRDVMHMFDDIHLWIYDISKKEKKSLSDKWRVLKLECMLRIPQYIPIKWEWWYSKIWQMIEGKK